jgi:RimJ/RimL family protein N-acetyltransferase
VTDRVKFATERLVARSWCLDDLPFAIELWGDPAVTALIDARGTLTPQQVAAKLCAEIDSEHSDGVQYWAVFDGRSGDFVGCGGLRRWIYTPDERNFELGFHLVKRCWGRGLAREAALAVLDYGWRNMGLTKVYAGHHPDNRASQRILERLGFTFAPMSFTNLLD